MKRRSQDKITPYLQKRFDERAALFAKKVRLSEAGIKSAYIKFELQQETYGIHFSDCTQVLSSTTISTIPFSRPFIKGIIHYDGAFIALLDLLQFFGYSSMHNSTEQCIIMIYHPKVLFGLLVNRIMGRDAYSKEQLTESLPDGFTQNKKYILGVHHGKTAILNLNTIVDDFISGIVNK